MNSRTLTLLALIIVSNILPSLAQVSSGLIKKKDAFCYLLKVNNIKPTDIHYVDDAIRNASWAEIYLRIFEPDKFKNSRHDEFQYQSLVSDAIREINTELQVINFEKQYVYLFIRSFDNYDFNRSVFPLKMYDENKNNNTEYTPYLIESVNNTYDMRFHFYIKSPYFVNHDKLTYEIPMAKEQASKFIASRKDNNGNINRDVVVEITYIFSKVGTLPKGYQCYLNAEIKKVTIYDQSSNKTLATLFPH